MRSMLVTVYLSIFQCLRSNSSCLKESAIAGSDNFRRVNEKFVNNVMANSEISIWNSVTSIRLVKA
jgi:hypothetical protein